MSGYGRHGRYPSSTVKTVEARCYSCGNYLTQTEHHFYGNKCTARAHLELRELMKRNDKLWTNLDTPSTNTKVGNTE